ncbi:YitT family protein [Mycoplasma corogypsi]|uniref:YitT family protein n=1 Tax=Mycoplasma corogypsi TaxID=2106 RepID=UPI0038736B51
MKQTTKYTRKRIKSTVLAFSFLYKIKTIQGKLLVITLVGLVMGLFGVFLLQNTGLYALGLEAFGQGIGNLAYYLIGSSTAGYVAFNICFWGIYFVLNIPLLVLSYKKISKEFTFYTCYYLFCFTLFGIGFGFIPGISKVYLFANLNANSPVFFSSEQVKIILWDYLGDSTKHIAVFLYSIGWGFLQGLAASFIIILAGSTGGFDILGMYIAKIKQRDIASIFFILNIIALTLANIIGTYIPASLSILNNAASASDLSAKAFELNLFISPNFIAGFVMLLVHAGVVNLSFPKYKMVQTQIFCDTPFELIDLINSKSDRQFTFSIHQVIGGYSKKQKFMITTNTYYLDAAYLFQLTKNINNDLFISIINIKKGDGYMFVED